MNAVLDNCSAPIVDCLGTADKALTQLSRGRRLRILNNPCVVAEDAEPVPVQLLEPTLDRNVTIGMSLEEPADDTNSHTFAGGRNRTAYWRRVSRGHDIASERSIEAVQLAIVHGLVS